MELGAELACAFKLALESTFPEVFIPLSYPPRRDAGNNNADNGDDNSVEIVDFVPPRSSTWPP